MCVLYKSAYDIVHIHIHTYIIIHVYCIHVCVQCVCINGYVCVCVCMFCFCYHRTRSWLDTLKRPDLKYNEIFPDEPGKATGLTVWQIENFNPVQLDERYHGRFYTGDCYIVLHTYFNTKSNLDWQIWYWIGQESTVSVSVPVYVRTYVCM